MLCVNCVLTAITVTVAAAATVDVTLRRCSLTTATEY